MEARENATKQVMPIAGIEILSASDHLDLVQNPKVELENLQAV